MLMLDNEEPDKQSEDALMALSGFVWKKCPVYKTTSYYWRGEYGNDVFYVVWHESKNKWTQGIYSREYIGDPIYATEEEVKITITKNVIAGVWGRKTRANV